MKKVWCMFFTILALAFGPLPYGKSQNVDLAKDLAEEGVTNEAKIEFVKVLHDPTKKASFDVAEYYLGYLSFKEQNYERALKHWDALLKNYPSSTYSEKTQQQIRIAALLLSKQQTEESENIEVNGLFNNADFLVGRPLKINIDSSYLSVNDMAIEMLEQIVTKYPQSPEAAKALFHEAEVLYGHGGRDGYGIASCLDMNSTDQQACRRIEQAHFEKMIDVLDRLRASYSDSPYIIPLTYLIGQTYWSLAGGKSDDNAKLYWQKVIDLAGNDKTNPYRQFAEWRLKGR